MLLISNAWSTFLQWVAHSLLIIVIIEMLLAEVIFIEALLIEELLNKMELIEVSLAEMMLVTTFLNNSCSLKCSS